MLLQGFLFFFRFGVLFHGGLGKHRYLQEICGEVQIEILLELNEIKDLTAGMI
jgi:hypothetical protein